MDGGAAGLLDRCVRELQRDGHVAGLDGDPQASCYPLTNMHLENLQPFRSIV